MFLGVLDPVSLVRGMDPDPAPDPVPDPAPDPVPDPAPDPDPSFIKQKS
jgi:hypothetical protein